MVNSIFFFPFSLISNSPLKTKKIGEILAKEILRSKIKRKKALILLLEGTLGAGKTTFVQGFAKGLGIREKISSPSFVIIKSFSLPSDKKKKKNHSFFQRLYHVDCYRLKKPEELFQLSFKEIASDPTNLILIEWGDIFSKNIPSPFLILKFRIRKSNTREIEFAII
jgi:tRNA threonylcarbamoyladenosine biosynthesis protein TsaE